MRIRDHYLPPGEFMRIGVGTAFLIIAASSTAVAQTAADEIAAGNRAYDALEEPGALQHYQKAIELDPKNYEALWKGARSAIDYGIPAPTAERRNALFAIGEQYARRAVAVNPNDPEGHFVLAWVLGKTALTQSARQP